MENNDIYALTPLGEGELRSSATRLTAAEIDVLVRLDGMLTVGQILASLAPEARAGFDAVFRSLLQRRLVTLVELDPFTRTWNAQVEMLTQAVRPAQADAGLAALQRSGFYVQIARERSKQHPAHPGRPLTAVVVEDDAALGMFTRTLLNLSGFEVRNAHNRAEVVAEIRRPPVPDLILLDVMLPDADGFDILQRVRQHSVLKDVPVIMLTGKATREAVLKGIAGGADGYITKPFEPESLLRAVRTVLGLPEEDPGAPPGTWGDPRLR
ncbi:response regulator [Ramlibacter alkalitolerans]|jgi:CheY-like chemotaxis protein|uniref:Response regulator n=1 Tax=Ramlibacter alkalitolerans TaxID=2039631 RepID=A0ABS1JRI7_9BURK|nr:response regulator [Ramlibacter alkalitolerans]MBL0426862.1 response regulator [Ramlibacter alkalitolerans]